MRKNIRVENLRLLVEEAGSVAELARRAKKGDSQLNQVLGGAKSSTGTPRGIGNKVAADLEAAMNKPEGWMDIDHSGEKPLKNRLKEKKDIVAFQVLAATASMGKGISEQLNHDFQVTSQESTLKWAHKNLSQASKLSNVRIITGLGDSMLPTFKEGDLLFVDTGIKVFDIDAVFVFALDGDLFIKRITRIRGGYKVKSDNEKHESWTLKKSELPEVRVIGRVITKASYEEM